jgi:hypothetical protein
MDPTVGASVTVRVRAASARFRPDPHLLIRACRAFFSRTGALVEQGHAEGVDGRANGILDASVLKRERAALWKIRRGAVGRFDPIVDSIWVAGLARIERLQSRDEPTLHPLRARKRGAFLASTSLRLKSATVP